MRLPTLAVVAVLVACKASAPEPESKPDEIAPTDSGAVVARAWAESRGAGKDFRATRTDDWAKGPRYHVEDARTTFLVYLEGDQVASVYDITSGRTPVCTTVAECNR
ncbi:MAG: hypothetical protein IAE99_07995 [Rhodothermales bacterium]|nr:hypothetical protein [Rhodothermales bacterium]